MKKLYLFDFDGTLTKRDTMLLYLQFYNPAKYSFQFVRHLPLFLLVQIGLADAVKVKRSFIASILKGQDAMQIEEKSRLFFERYYPSLFRQNALDFIQNIDRTTTDCFIVSASLDIWLKPFANYFGMKLISTEAKFADGKFTGNFSTKNCNGAEKVSRIMKEITNKKYDKIIAFGDTSGDQPMLNFADEPYYRFFH